ncbi:hypothetical protein [Paraburkholderia terrae]
MIARGHLPAAKGHAMMYQYPHALASAVNRFITQSQARPRQTAKAAQLHEQA